MEANNFDIFSVSLSEVPKFEENKYKEWVNFGADNNYPEFLLKLINYSAVHNAIISSKVDAVRGTGLQYEGDTNAKADAYLQRANPEETYNEVYFKCAYDLVIFGGFALEVVKNGDVYHVDFTKVRSGTKDAKGKVSQYWLSKNWSKYRQTEFKPIPIPAYKNGVGLIYSFDYIPGVEFYPLPTYVGALTYIETDCEIANFHLNNIKNGMCPSMSMTFTNGIPDEDQRRENKRRIQNSYTGTKNAGKIIINYVNSKDEAPIIDAITPDQLDKQFIQLQETVMANILAGHKVTSPLLVGIRGSEGLGNNANEMQSAFELYNNQVITPLKEQLLKVFNKLAAMKGIPTLYVETVAPISFTYSENAQLQILTKDEMRANIGYAPLSESINEPNKIA